MIATNASFKDIRTEIVRKSLHFLIALTPSLASMNLVSRITALAARPRDSGRFVLGPVTLGLGALASLSFYPEPAAAIAIYALAFGDGIASLAGKLFGRTRIPFTGGKSLEGSFACFIAVFSATYGLTRSPGGSAAVAAFATLVEALPVKDLDNLILPLAVGSFATLVFG
jgi:phytol kinase